MFCRKCGQHLTELDNFCHSCGEKVKIIETNQVNSQSINNAGNYSPEKKQNNKNQSLFIIIGVVFISFIAVFIFDNFFSRNSIQSLTTEDYSFSGYIFSVPKECKVSIEDDNLYIDSADVRYVLNTDYTNTYASYIYHYTEKYSDQERKAINKINGREYLIYHFTIKSTSGEISEFFTKLDDNATIAGIVTHNDGSTVTIEDYYKLTNIINSAKLFNNDKRMDAGRNGFVDFTTKKIQFFA